MRGCARILVALVFVFSGDAVSQTVRVGDGSTGMESFDIKRTDLVTGEKLNIQVDVEGIYSEGYLRNPGLIAVKYSKKTRNTTVDVDYQIRSEKYELVADPDCRRITLAEPDHSSDKIKVSGRVASAHEGDASEACRLISMVLTGNAEITRSYLLGEGGDFAVVDFRKLTTLRERLRLIDGSQLPTKPVSVFILSNWELDGDVTALHLASKEGCEDVVQDLIREGADVNAQSGSGLTPLCMAAAGGYESTVKLLVQAGANIQAMAEGGQSPLIDAASGGHDSIVAFLLESGADPNASLKTGFTALHFAANRGDEAIVRSLLEKGAKTNVATITDATPMSLAKARGHDEIVRLLDATK